MKVEGWLRLNSTNGRAELQDQGETYSFPARFASTRATITIPDAQQARQADPIGAAGGSADAIRGIFRMQNGRAELGLTTGEVISFPARLAGRVIGIEVMNLSQAAERQVGAFQAQGAAAQAALERVRNQSDRAALSIPFDEDDLDVLG